MTFPLTPAAPFTASVSTISAATANAWRTYIARSLDTVDGGAYANTTAVSWDAGSAGWTFNGPLTVGATSTFVMTAGATVTLAADATVSSGGGWDFEGGSLCRFRGTVGGATLQVDDNAIVTCAGDVTWSATSTQTYAASSAQTHASGSSDVYSSGATLTIASGAVATLNLGGVSAAGVTFIGANGSAIWNGASTATWQTGSFATWDSGSTMACNGASTWGATSTQTHASGSSDTYSSGAIFTLNSGAVVNVTVGATNAGTATWGALSVQSHVSGSTDTYDAGADLTLNNTVTHTGRMVRSGASAYTEIRWTNAADAANPAVEGKAQDYLDLTMAAGPYDWNLVDGTAGKPFAFKIRVSAVAGTDILTVKTAGGGLIYAINPGAGNEQTVEFVWDGGNWRTGLVGVII